MHAIPPQDLARFESLGDNCEIGFVLRHLGSDSGSLLKWARSEADQVCELLGRDFADIYHEQALSPFRAAMVQEARYGIQWHSILQSHVVGGRWQFVADAATRAVQYQHEARKMRYLVGKLKARLAAGGLIAIVKSNGTIEPGVLDRLQAELQRHSRGARNTLLEVRAARLPQEIGEVVPVRPGLLRGAVARLAPYDAADDIDYASWQSVLQMALLRSPCSDWPRREAQAAAVIDSHTVTLNFPGARSADPRGGIALLRGGNQWCRVVDEGYRMHGAAPGHPATTLCWNAVQPPPRSQLNGMVTCAIQESAPVRLTVLAGAPLGDPAVRQEFVVEPGAPALIAIELPDGIATHASVQIIAQAGRPLQPGEQAAVDVSILSLERRN